VNGFGISFLKLDYNINPGAGTEWLAASAGDGLLAHTRAFQEWLVSVQQRHDGLLIENCASGAMRADYSLLDRTHLQSTSDQQDFRLYPPIAASAPATILPEQCGNWAYPAVDMSDEETAFTLVTGLSGRLYLSGFLHELRAEQRALVQDAVGVHRRIRGLLAGSVPFWPLGLPAWDDEVVCVGFQHGEDDGATLVVWDRRHDSSTIEVRGITGRVSEVFPTTLPPWQIESFDEGVRFGTVPGLTARVFRVEGARGPALPNRA
jgi:alpha-galactosidase